MAAGWPANEWRKEKGAKRHTAREGDAYQSLAIFYGNPHLHAHPTTSNPALSPIQETEKKRSKEQQKIEGKNRIPAVVE
jgi:hypothetical protein